MLLKKGNILLTIFTALAIIISGFFISSCGETQKSEEVKQSEKTEQADQAAETEEQIEDKESIKIGVIGAHSGDLASYGIPTINAATIIVEKYNAQGGINGRSIEIIVEDDGCKPEMATSAAVKVVGEKVNSVIGHICSGATKAAIGIYKESNIITISPSATNPPLTQSGEYPNFFRTIASDDAQAKLEVDFVLDVLNLTKIAIIHDKGDYGKGFAEFVKQFLENDQRAEVVLYEGITPGAVDYSAIVNKIKESEAEAIIYGGYHPEASKIVTQIRKKNMKTVFVSDDGVKDETFIKVAKEYAEGVYATGPMDTSSNPLTIEAIKEHEAKYGEYPGAFYLNAYAAMLALLNAYEVSNSIEYDDIVQTLRTEYVDTPLGKISFDEKGDAIGIGFSMYQVKEGRFVEIKQ
ncbi:MAG: branched-chain amino acid ABC transporter substrate-binding protein [Deltaproteobacteria bacterium]|nr:branched-chain amino acid ABC transporter substrate-binding protein [Deltaproteobacteria bacterium]